jgi:hypothetical protein
MSAWSQLLEETDWCRGRGAFPLPAYSEYLPPHYFVRKPYGEVGPLPLPQADDCGWRVNEYEEGQILKPGMKYLARCALRELMRLGKGQRTPQISHNKLVNNPYWPDSLAAHAGQLPHERYVLLLATTLSRTQDDKGRLRWTLFGASEQGPGKAFWRGFFTAPGVEAPLEHSTSFFIELLSRCYGVPERQARDPAKAGLRVLPAEDDGPLPSWAAALAYQEGNRKGVRFLLTFRPFALLPAEVQNAYVRGELHLLPFPGSLLFWGVGDYRRLERQLPFAVQIPLLHLYPRRHDPGGLRIPQSGWLHIGIEPGEKDPGPHRPLFVRTHRWQKVRRHVDEVALVEHGDPVTRVLFSTEPDDIDLYNKPMARNVQIWSRNFRLILNGPIETQKRIYSAEAKLLERGSYGYRFLYPAMRIGTWELYWHRPVVAFAASDTNEEDPQPVMLESAPMGYMTAYRGKKPDLERPVELWPRLLDRPLHRAAVELFREQTHPRPGYTTTNLRSLLEWYDLLGGGPLSRELARSLLAIPQDETLETWLAGLPEKSSDQAACARLVKGLKGYLALGGEPEPAGEGLTFARTATREFEETYWHTIADLAHGRFRTKSNADCVHDAPTRKERKIRLRQLDTLGNHLVREYQNAIRRAKVAEAWVGEHAFSWKTDFDFTWMGGWLRNQKKPDQECNIIMRIPGRDPTQAVVMADHYDTAYMHDHYYKSEGGSGARVAAAGADDNHSATSALLLAAPILLDLSREGRLGCDVWLIHLTGEEFPSDCLGARHLSSDLVQGTLCIRDADGHKRDLSGTRVRGLFVSDMIAHNVNEHYVYQMAPGEGPASARMAQVAHQANLVWNALAEKRNQSPPRLGAKKYERSADPEKVPALAPHAILRGEIRPDHDPRSTLYNTDGQIFSDVGVPVVLFMEDYDIDRKGYHDSYDTMENIDLDYGSALAAIVIETVARAAQ